MTDVINDEILDILRERKIDEKLLESQQLEREKERAELLNQLDPQVRADEENNKKLAARRRDVENRLREAEAAAAAARREMCDIESESMRIGFNAERLRGKLRKLADPRIEASINILMGFAGRSRSAFKSKSISVRIGLMGGRSNVDESNSMEIAEALALITAAIERLKNLQEQPRPADVAAFIENNEKACRGAVRKLIGV